jgi:hypothetical protein
VYACAGLAADAPQAGSPGGSRHSRHQHGRHLAEALLPPLESEIIASYQPSHRDPSTITVAEAFALHSRPNAPRTILLDFDGHTTTGVNVCVCGGGVAGAVCRAQEQRHACAMNLKCLQLSSCLHMHKRALHPRAAGTAWNTNTLPKIVTPPFDKVCVCSMGARAPADSMACSAVSCAEHRACMCGGGWQIARERVSGQGCMCLDAPRL